MNITAQIAELAGEPLKTIIESNKEIQFYASDNGKYKWRDNRFESSAYIDYNTIADSKEYLILLFKKHLQQNYE